MQKKEWWIWRSEEPVPCPGDESFADGVDLYGLCPILDLYTRAMIQAGRDVEVRSCGHRTFSLHNCYIY